MKNLKLITSGFVLCMVALVYVVSYAQTTTPTKSSDDKKSCCMKMKEGEGASCCAKMKEGKGASCCAGGVCKMKDKNSAHAEMKSGECCKMKAKNANAQAEGDKAEGSCACCAGGSCCADGVCKMKDKNHATQNSNEKESCCSGDSCCGCCQKKAA